MNGGAKARVRPLTLEPGRRVLAISDIHGKLSWLKALLQKAAFSPDDVLVLLGDLVERGEESLGTLRYVMELTRGGNVHFVTGNCDTLALDVLHRAPYMAAWLRDHPQSVMLQLAEEGGFAYRGPEDMAALGEFLFARYPEELAFLTQSPTILESEDFVFVHGGVPSLECMGELNAWKCMKNDDFMNQGHAFPKYCVVGHWPTSIYCTGIPCCNPIVDRGRKIVSIDGGCGVKAGGQLNALVISNGAAEEFSWVTYDEYPTALALDPQEGSTDPVTLRWVDNAVEVLERGEELTLCRQKSTGRTLWVPTRYLWGGPGEERCEDVTDYCLPVSAGDRLSLLVETGQGVLVKRDGVIGWYLGRLGQGKTPVK